MKSPDKRKIIKISMTVAVILLLVAILIAIMPFFFELVRDEKLRSEFIGKIKSLGVGGFFVLTAIQIFQVVVAFIPGEPIELAAGACFGTVMGLLLCYAGLLLGSAVVFYFVRRLGYPFVVRVFGEEKLVRFKFLRNEKQLESVIFILFLIPGTPKDILTYFAGITKISMSRFLIISSVARIPSVVSSTLIGNSLIDGDYTLAIIMFGATALIGLGGIYINDRFVSGKNGKKSNKTDSEDANK